MLFDLNGPQEGEWFQFFTSRIDPNTGDTIYDPPASDARARIRSIVPFVEERAAKRQRVFEHVYNPKTRAMERIGFYSDLSPEQAKAEREDMIDYTITGLENFKDSATGKEIACTRENKILLMRNPVFDRFVARCWQLLGASRIAAKEEAEKN